MFADRWATTDATFSYLSSTAEAALMVVPPHALDQRDRQQRRLMGSCVCHFYVQEITGMRARSLERAGSPAKRRAAIEVGWWVQGGPWANEPLNLITTWRVVLLLPSSSRLEAAARWLLCAWCAPPDRPWCAFARHAACRMGTSRLPHPSPACCPTSGWSAATTILTSSCATGKRPRAGCRWSTAHPATATAVTWWVHPLLHCSRKSCRAACLP